LIFLDTGFLCALFSEDDEHHERAWAVLDQHDGRLLADFVITTNHIVSETITVVRNKAHRDADVRHRIAVDVGRKLFAGAFASIHQATPEEERTAFDYFERYADKDYSFVDCLSFVVMEKLGIDTAWAVDDDFTHRFTAVPGPKPKR
jgi:uncharacterized protein